MRRISSLRGRRAEDRLNWRSARRRQRGAARTRAPDDRQHKINNKTMGGCTMRTAQSLLRCAALALLAQRRRIGARTRSSSRSASAATGTPRSSEVGQRAGIFKKHGLVLEILYTQGARRDAAGGDFRQRRHRRRGRRHGRARRVSPKARRCASSAPRRPAPAISTGT